MNYLNPRAMKPMVSCNALRCGAFNGAKGGAMIGYSGTMYVVQWCGVMVRVWCDGTVQWCDGTVQWCDGTVQWCDGAVQCPIETNLLHQCTPVHPSHCTEKIAAKTRFFATKTCIFADKKLFFAIKKWCGGPGAVVQLTGTLVQS